MGGGERIEGRGKRSWIERILAARRESNSTHLRRGETFCQQERRCRGLFGSEELLRARPLPRGGLWPELEGLGSGGRKARPSPPWGEAVPPPRGGWRATRS